MQFAFTLKYQLATPWRRGDDAVLAPALATAGVQLVRRRRDRLRLDFRREGPDVRLAMRCAIAEMGRVIPDAMLAEAAPDYVGLGALARLFGLSRQAMRQVMVSRAGRFPHPVHEVHAAVWHLATILEWMDAMRLYRFDLPLLETARAAQAINLALDARRMREVRRHTARLIELPREIAALLRHAGLPA
ncbi:MAG TPA: DNA-binding protein [Steroidobacteraceae bacterium]|nr:DNA-binding protein [Steroidobacteraceae bacterium]